MRNSIQITVLVSVLGMLLPNDASADVIIVPADQTTIQKAIVVAEDGDEVVVAPGTYNEIIDLLGKAITVRSSDGAAVTIIDANGVADPGDGLPVVRCDNFEGPGTVIDGFTITGGTGDNTLVPGFRFGGGMFNDGSSPTLANCTFSGNNADLGGGMYNDASSPTVTNCTFSGNTATNEGGGMRNRGSNTVVTNCTFSGNTANNGGGMYNASSSPTVTNCIFWGNSDVGGADESGQIHLERQPWRRQMGNVGITAPSYPPRWAGIRNLIYFQVSIAKTSFSRLLVVTDYFR